MATGEITGKVNIPTKTALYTGLETDTAVVTVDNLDKTIAVDVKKEAVVDGVAKSIEATQDETSVELSLKNSADEVISSTTFNVESSPIIDSKNITEYDDASLKKFYRDIPAQGEDVKDSIYYVNKEYVHYTREVHVNEEIANFSTSSELNVSQIFQCLGGDVDTVIDGVILSEDMPVKVFPQYVQDGTSIEWQPVYIEDMQNGEEYRLNEASLSTLVYNDYYRYVDLFMQEPGPNNVIISGPDHPYDDGDNITKIWWGHGEFGLVIDAYSDPENVYYTDELMESHYINTVEFTLQNFAYEIAGDTAQKPYFFSKKIETPTGPTDLSFKLGASKANGMLGFRLKPGIPKVTLGVKVWGNDATPSIIVNGVEKAINPALDTVQEVEVNLTDDVLVLTNVIMAGKPKRFTLHYIKQTLQGDAVYTKQYLGQGGGSTGTGVEMATPEFSSIKVINNDMNNMMIYNPDYYPEEENNRLNFNVKIINADALQVGDEIQLCRYVVSKRKYRVYIEDQPYQPKPKEPKAESKGKSTTLSKGCTTRLRRIVHHELTAKDIEQIKSNNMYTISLDYDNFIHLFKMLPFNKGNHAINSMLHYGRNNLYIRILRRVSDNTNKINDDGVVSSGKSLQTSCHIPTFSIYSEKGIASSEDRRNSRFKIISFSKNNS